MWREAYLETRVLSADPMELVCLLYQHSIDAVREARRRLAARDIAGRGQSISKAIGILGELTVSLDHGAGGELSRNLERLYAYMIQRLTEANLRQQDGLLAEVESLLATLADAWHQAREKQMAQPPLTPPIPAFQEAQSEYAAHGWNG
ncbi:MAG TPA: flagellar export chaperone FliS [Bryobacteraceae bacterium]|nr:flagellar export chaperone FliS [Bryobacteraceae bacterium]